MVTGAPVMQPVLSQAQGFVPNQGMPPNNQSQIMKPANPKVSFYNLPKYNLRF